MVLIEAVVLAIIIGVYGNGNGECIRQPLQTATTEFGTMRQYCKYERRGPNNSVVSLMLTIGSVFETLDSCSRCRCTEYGFECCSTGHSFAGYTMNPPKGCHVVRDGCDEYLVYKSDNVTDCMTGKTVQNMKYDLMMQQRQNRIMDEMMRNWAMDTLGINKHGGRQANGNGAEYDPSPMQQMRMYDMLLRSMTPSNTGPYEPVNVPENSGNAEAPAGDPQKGVNGMGNLGFENILPVISLFSLFA